MININGLSFAYKKDYPIFLNFNWNIAPGERWSVIGPSGCGKTTLLYLLAGLKTPSAGKISINNRPSNGHKALTGLILQDYGLLPWATAFENVAIGLKIQGTEKKQINRIVEKWLREMGIEEVASHYPSELSGGQQQRVAIARTLALEPPVILMDEPFAALDALTREDSLKLVLRLWRDHTSTMVLVTHNIEEAAFWGARILVLSKPPNTHPVIIDNPGSGTPEYINSPDFNSRCKQLRELIEQHARNDKAETQL
jgi:ABC-type nitrate/sulfonate/bicarbonate transport system ATPase subunit